MLLNICKSICLLSKLFSYVTPNCRATFVTEADLMAFTQLVIEETNQGYINSDIPVSYLHSHLAKPNQVRISKLGVSAHPTIHDEDNSTSLINAFDSSMASWDLFNCADVASLLVADFDSCGIAKFDTATSCRTVSVTQKDCATGYYRYFFKISENICC